jgi:hypothetical protein
MRVLGVAHTVPEEELSEADWVISSLVNLTVTDLETFMGED